MRVADPKSFLVYKLTHLSMFVDKNILRTERLT